MKEFVSENLLIDCGICSRVPEFWCNIWKSLVANFWRWLMSESKMHWVGWGFYGHYQLLQVDRLWWMKQTSHAIHKSPMKFTKPSPRFPFMANKHLHILPISKINSQLNVLKLDSWICSFSNYNNFIITINSNHLCNALIDGTLGQLFTLPLNSFCCLFNCPTNAFNKFLSLFRIIRLVNSLKI